VHSELILTTYNSPRALLLCLTSIRAQRVGCDGICVADDGSGPETAAVIERFREENPGLALRHVWHEDAGFRKCAILNRAIASSPAAFLVFLDGDVMIHPDFIARHLQLARRGRFSTGSLIRLDAAATASVTPQMVATGVVFDRGWLRANRALDKLSTWLKTAPLPKAVLNLLEVTSPVRRVLCGANWSAYRDDILAVNGFDETITYGGLDKELGERMTNAGTPGRHLRFTAPLVHLDHPRGYADPARMRANKDWIRKVRRDKITWTTEGIAKGPAA
jgi:glycosyltransferase involved in cell wall biosynthesis